jgi:hypothetical protein
VGLIDRVYDGAGRSGGQEYRKRARDWRRRAFGRAAVVFWTVYAVALLAAMHWTPESWNFTVGGIFGAAAMAALLLTDVLMPDRISRWERGQWGEQKTASAIRALKREGWTIRHDLATGFGSSNYDHIAAGRGVYLLDSKLLTEVREEYMLKVGRKALADARSLERKIEAAVGFPVAVYPVVVIWSPSDTGEKHVGGVDFIEGDRLADWLRRRPTDLLHEHKVRAVQDWLGSLQAA